MHSKRPVKNVPTKKKKKQDYYKKKTLNFFLLKHPMFAVVTVKFDPRVGVNSPIGYIAYE